MKKSTLLFVVIMLLTGSLLHGQQITVTVAGTGTPGFSGDAGPAQEALLHSPNDVCVDAARNLYFTDHDNGRIRKVSAATGLITTVAGGGSSVADGVPATDAFLSPNYLCISPAGDIYVTSGNSVKKIKLSTGIITTVAGGSAPGYGGDAGPASAAMLDNPQGICLDPFGNLFIVDRNNHAIRRVNSVTGTITTICGGGPSSAGYSGDGGAAAAALLKYPAVICSNSYGDIYFSDQNPAFPLGYDNSRIRKISAVSGIVTAVAGSSSGSAVHSVPAMSALLGTITGLCCDAAGNLFCNEMSCSCRRLGISNDTLFNVAGNFYIQGYSDDISSPLANMDHPNGLCVDNRGALYIADNFNHRIRKVVTLTHAPAFTYGDAQAINAGSGVPYVLNTAATMTDIDSAQAETWQLVTPPSFGTISGIPASALSLGKHQVTRPSAISYTSSAHYYGPDMFRISVSDGIQSDTITIFVNVGASSGGFTTGMGSVNNNAEVNAFPNPVSSTLRINWSKQTQDEDIVAIKDVMGRTVYCGHAASGGSTQVDVSSLPAGNYFISVNDKLSGKFEKQ